MKKKILCFLLTGMLISVFTTGCKGPGDQKEQNITGNIGRENLEYYCYFSGSSSLSEEFIIYQYEDEFIFAADYFNCGQGYIETYALTEEQVAGVLEEINSVSVVEEEEEEETTDGGYRANGVMLVDHDYYNVGRIDFEEIGIEVKDANEVEYPSEEVVNSFEINGFKELQESEQWKNTMMSSGIRVFGEVIKEQAETELGAVIGSMTVDELGNEDLRIKLHTEEGEVYTAVVTYRGYVADIEKEK